jgi:hypothetical protein
MLSFCPGLSPGFNQVSGALRKGRVSTALVFVVLSACGGGGGSSGGSGVAPTYTVSVNLSGLAGTGCRVNLSWTFDPLATSRKIT